MLITTPRSLLSSHPLPSVVPIPLLLTPPPMKDRRSGAGIFPFSVGCMSQSAVSVADQHGKKQPQNDPSSSSSSSTTNAESEEEGGGEKARSAAAIVAAGVQRLIKSLSQMFATYDDEDEGEEEREMVIGFPTDVQHVGHIGWDGLNKVGGMGMVNAFSLPPPQAARDGHGGSTCLILHCNTRSSPT